MLLAFLAACSSARSVPGAPEETPGLLIAPAVVSLFPGERARFDVFGPSVDTTAVVWSIGEGNTGGTIAYGMYHAPATPGTYHVAAAYLEKTTAATVTVGSCDELLTTEDLAEIEAGIAKSNQESSLADYHRFLARTQQAREAAAELPGFFSQGSTTAGAYRWESDRWVFESPGDWVLFWNDGYVIRRVDVPDDFGTPGYSSTTSPAGHEFRVEIWNEAGVVSRSATFALGHIISHRRSHIYGFAFGDWSFSEKVPYATFVHDVSDENPPRDMYRLHYHHDGNDIEFVSGKTLNWLQESEPISAHIDFNGGEYSFVVWNGDVRYAGIGPDRCILETRWPWYIGFPEPSPVPILVSGYPRY